MENGLEKIKALSTYIDNLSAITNEHEDGGEISQVFDEAKRLSQIEALFSATGWVQREDIIWLIKTLKEKL